ncbi:MAG: hypothetical protein V7641_267 [Blastocatellia bacterium]
MKRNLTRLFSLVIIATFCCTPGICAPSDSEAAKLLNNVIRAHGAQRALSCNSIVLDVDVLLNPQDGTPTNGQIFVKANLFRLEYDLSPTSRYRMGYDGNQAWILASSAAKTPKTLDLLQVRLFQFYALIFSPRWIAFLKDQSGTLRYGGQETYRGAKTEVLQANVETIGNVDFLVESNTYLLKGIRFVFPGEKQPHYEISYDSYVNTNGLKIAKTIDIFRNNLLYREYKIKAAKPCNEVADAVFAPDIK